MAVPYPVINDVPPRTQSIAGLNQFIYSTTWTASEASDILVYSRSPAVPANDITQLVSSTNYTVQFIGSDNLVQVTFNALENPPQFNIVTIVRNTPSDFLNNYTNTNFLPSMLNSDFDNVTLANQQTQLWNQIAPHYNYSEVLNFPIDLILPILGANQFWAKNNTNTAFEAVNVDEISGAPANGPYVLTTVDADLPDAFSLGSLSSGILKQTVSGVVSTPSIAINGTDYYGPGFTGYFQSPAGVKDINGNIVLGFESVASAVNYIALQNASTGNSPTINALGTDTNIGLALVSKGTSGISTFTGGNIPFQIYTGNAFQHISNLIFPTNSNTINITFRDLSGTVAYLSDVAGAVTSAQGTANQVLINGTSGTPETGALIFTLPQNIATTSSPTFANLTLTNGTLFDVNGNVAFGWSATASAVNYLTTINQITTQSPQLTPAGSDTNIGILFQAKGTGQFALSSLNSTPLMFETGTAYQHITNFIFANTSATRNVTWPDASGTVAFTSSLPTPAALTETNDTNVTMTLGGTPSTALLQAVSMTLGWTGQLSLARGGSNASLTASNGGIVYSTATAMAILAGTSTAQQLLVSGASTAPQWTTSTYPLTNAINTLLYASSANVMSALTTANNGVLVTSAGGVPSISSILPSNVLNTTGIFSQVVIQTFTSNGTYTPTANMKYCVVECVGGGGGGGGVATTSAIQTAAGGGGGAGEYARSVFTAATIGASKTVAIGGAGTAGSSSGGNGGAGGNTTLGSTLIIAVGGSGGTGMAAQGSSSSAAGGAGGTAGTGTVLVDGGSGMPSIANYVATAYNVRGGEGGSSLFGMGGPSVLRIAISGGSSSGSAANGFGSGGGGAANCISASGISGSVGNAGYMIITEYI